jgi:hypothetical protein
MLAWAPFTLPIIVHQLVLLTISVPRPTFVKRGWLEYV